MTIIIAIVLLNIARDELIVIIVINIGKEMQCSHLFLKLLILTVRTDSRDVRNSHF